MRKTETQGFPAVQMVTSVMLGGLLALGIELMVLLAGSAAVSGGVLKEDIAPQLTVAACVVGCLVGGALACTRWKSRRLLAGALSGLVCYLLILAVGLLLSDRFELGLQALIELAGCLCGGAIAGMFAGRCGKKRRPAARKK